MASLLKLSLLVVATIGISSSVFAKNQYMDMHDLREQKLSQAAQERRADHEVSKSDKTRQNSKESFKSKRAELLKDKRAVLNTSVLKDANFFSKVKRWWMRLTFSIKAFFRKSYYSALNFDKSASKMSPPEATGIDYDQIGFGTSPEMIFYTYEPVSDDGEVVTAEWNFGDGTIVTIPFEELDEYATVSHIYKDIGHFTVTLTLTDDSSEQTVYSMYSESDSNQVPTPKFTTSVISGTAPLEVEFTSLMEDADGDSWDYQWKYGDGSSSDDGDFEVHTFNDPGVYRVRFSVRDENHGYRSAYVDIYVDEAPPAGGTRPSPVVNTSASYGEGPLTVTFDGLSSFDIDGSIAEYFWDFGDYNDPVNYATTGTATHTYNLPGTYYATLTVKDNYGLESSKSVAVYVGQGSPLTPQITAFQRTSNGLKVKFDSNVRSHRETAPSENYYWDFGDGNTDVATISPEHTYASAGTYTVKMNVVDIQGVRHEVQKNITVASGRDEPTVKLSIGGTSMQLDSTMTANGSLSTDPASSDPLEYRFDFGDGSQITGSNSSESHAYDVNGLYAVNLLVTNSRGISKNTSRFMSVLTGSSPLVDLRFDPKVGETPLAIHFDATRTKFDNSSIVDYQWLVNDEYVSSSTSMDYTFEDAGEHSVKLVVTDSLGNRSMIEKFPIALEPGSIPNDNEPPVAELAYFADSENPQKYNFDCYESYDDDGYIAFCDWKINGTSLPDAESFEYTFPDKTVYSIELTVTDDVGAKTTVVKNVDLSQDAATKLVLNYGPINPKPSQVVNFSADGSFIDGATIDSYAWSFGDGGTASGVNVSHTYASNGTYTATLTITDSGSNTHTISKSVVVQSTLSPVLKLTVQDAESLKVVTNGGTYYGSDSPETVRLSLRSTKQSFTSIADATWTFGDGKTGFGTELEYTYHKPGTYSLSVVGKDGDGNTASASATIIIPDSSCKSSDSQTTCLTLDNAVGNILPFSSSSWTIGHDLGASSFSTSSADLVKSWIKLVSQDGSEKAVSLADIATISTNKINLDKVAIEKLNIDLTLPYRIYVNTRDTSGNEIIGRSPEFYFGSGILNISAEDGPGRIQLVHSGAQWQNFSDITGSTSQIINIPSGQISLVYYKGDQAVAEHFEVASNKPTNHSISFASLLKKRNLLAKAKINSKRPHRQAFIAGKSVMASSEQTSQGLCGDIAPFETTATRNIDEGTEYVWNFSSVAPMKEATFRDISREAQKPLKLSCAINSESLNYAFAKWKYKDGPQRCFNQDVPHTEWANYLKRLRYEGAPTTLVYQVRDQWTGEVFTSQLVTSPRDALARQGMGLDQLGWRVGLPLAEGVDWNQRENFDLIIPPHFQKPQIRFEMYPAFAENDVLAYDVDCDVLQSNAKPKITAIRAKSGMNQDVGTSNFNGLISLQKRYGFSPIHEDSRSSSAQDVLSNIGKATYEVVVSNYDRTDITWQGVKIQWTYGEKTFDKVYLFDGTNGTDLLTGNLVNTVTFDSADIASELGAAVDSDKAAQTVQMSFTPVGKISVDYDYEGAGSNLFFVPLMDLQALKDLGHEVCENGFYPSSVSSFVTADVLSVLEDKTVGMGALRCGDASLPFGGPFDVSAGWKHNGHKLGNAVRTRTLQAGTTTQDDYDQLSGSSSLRHQDVEEYLTLVSDVDTIAAETQQNVGGVDTPKKKILDYCMTNGDFPEYPCVSTTDFTNITADTILNLCQWHEIDGCPVVDMTKIVRFSKWVEANAGGLSGLLARYSVIPRISSGSRLSVAGASGNDWQYQALVLGVWPDGKPIWKVSDDSKLVNERVLSCHANKHGCSSMSRAFENNKSDFDSILLSVGWR